MNKETAILLLQKHIDGTLTESERNELAAFINKNQNRELVIASLETLLTQQRLNSRFDERRFMPLLEGIFKSETDQDEEVVIRREYYRSRKRKFPWKAILWVFLALLIIAAAVYYYYFRSFPFFKLVFVYPMAAMGLDVSFY